MAKISDEYVKYNCVIAIKPNTKPWIYLLRQLFVCSGVYAMLLITGISTGTPNVMIPQLRREANSTEAVSEDMASWLTSVHGYAAIPWTIILPMISRRFGRKILFILISFSSLMSFILSYFSTNTDLILASEIIQGLIIGSNLTVLIVIVTEYTSPCYRGIFLTHKTTMYFVGIWIASAIGAYSYWKHIIYVAMILSLYSLTAVLWPESPSWLAMKGRFEECAAAHHWLRGHDENSENDLKSLINTQKEYIRINSQEKSKSWCNVKELIRLTTKLDKTFYKTFLICLACLTLFACTGKITCMLYSLTLIENLTNSESTAYIGMLVIEAISICSMEIGCILSKRLKRRTLLLGSCTAGVICQFVISLYLFLISLTIITENYIVTLTLLTLFSSTISMGPMILAYGLCGEITPLRFKSFSLPILAIYGETLVATLLKITPFMYKFIGVHGAFLFYGLATSTLAFILYKFLPETKDKTLQEIEAYFKGTISISTASESACANPLLDKGHSHHPPLSSV